MITILRCAFFLFWRGEVKRNFNPWSIFEIYKSSRNNAQHFKQFKNCFVPSKPEQHLMIISSDALTCRSKIFIPTQ